MKTVFVTGEGMFTAFLAAEQLAIKGIKLSKEKQQLEKQQLKALTVKGLRETMKRIDTIEAELEEVNEKIKILMITVIL